MIDIIKFSDDELDSMLNHLDYRTTAGRYKYSTELGGNGIWHILFCGA